MEHLLEENVAAEDLKKFEARYQAELSSGLVMFIGVGASAQFDYAWCLVRSKYPSDIRKGILLLEDLYTVRFLVYQHKIIMTRNYSINNYLFYKHLKKLGPRTFFNTRGAEVECLIRKRAFPRTIPRECTLFFTPNIKYIFNGSHTWTWCHSRVALL